MSFLKSNSSVHICVHFMEQFNSFKRNLLLSTSEPHLWNTQLSIYSLNFTITVISFCLCCFHESFLLFIHHAAVTCKSHLPSFVCPVVFLSNKRSQMLKILGSLNQKYLDQNIWWKNVQTEAEKKTQGHRYFTQVLLK